MTTATHNVKVNSGRQHMDLMQLIDQFGSEDHCRAYLEHLRWPDGVRCVNCGMDSISRITTRNQFDCNACRTRFSVKAGTVFHDSHLPLRKWFLAVYMMGEARKGVSANQLKRTLAVSYKTAWYLCHRIRSAMDNAAPVMLSGTVEVDETYIGGKSKNMHKDVRARRITGRGGVDKTMILGAIQRGGNVRLRVETRTASGDVVREFIDGTVADGAEAIYTDKHRAYDGIGDEDTRHEAVNHAMEEWIRGDVGTNNIESAWSLFKRAIVGSYHQLSEKHLQAYADEFAFRFNNRENPYLFRDTLRALIKGEPLTYDALVDGAAPTRPTHSRSTP
jgi:transposase-like protein